MKIDTLKIPIKTDQNGKVMIKGDFILGESIMIEPIKLGFLPMDPVKYELKPMTNEAKVIFKPTPG